MLDLASHIVDTKAAHFDPSKFDDRYEDALKDLLRKKQEGKPIERPERRQPARVIDLRDALRRSVEASGTGPSAKAKATSPPSANPNSRSVGRHSGSELPRRPTVNRQSSSKHPDAVLVATRRDLPPAPRSGADDRFHP